MSTAQPLTVIAPPLEWGEWESRPDLGDNDSSKESLCFRYIIWRRGNRHNCAFGGKRLTPDPVCTELEAKAVCQAHRQAIVNAALEGCNIVPYRDPQGLVDALNKIVEDVETDKREAGKSLDPMITLSNIYNASKETLKAWEEGK